MTAAIVLDVLLAVALPVLAWQALRVRDLYRGVILFIAFGLLVALSWARLEAPDVALAEAAISAGLTGVIFLNTLGSLSGGTRPAGEGDRPEGESVGPVDRARRSAAARLPVALGALVLAATLGWAVMTMPNPPVDLAGQVANNLDESGVSHPITAVLLNFRSYDTLLEIGVLLLALVCVWSLGLSRYHREQEVSPTAAPILYGLVRMVAPVMVLVSGYLLYAGSTQPGGAFKAGAVLAAAGVLVLLTGMVGPPLHRSGLLRLSLTVGFGVFLAVACVGFFSGRLLEYPAGWDYPLILLIEAALTVSIAVTLIALAVAAPPRRRGQRDGAAKLPEEGR